MTPGSGWGQPGVSCSSGSALATCRPTPSVRRGTNSLPPKGATGSGGTATSLTRTTRRSEEHTSELQSRLHLVCRLLLEKKKKEPQGGGPIEKRYSLRTCVKH